MNEPESSSFPVVLVHGALRGKLGLVPTSMYLRRAGLDARPFGYPTRKDTLEGHALRLSAFISQWLSGHMPVPQMGILTHSMGGLVARMYLSLPEARQHAERVKLVMLAPPNQGAQLAEKSKDMAAFRMLYGAAATELLPSRVQQIPDLPPHCDIRVLAGGRGHPRGINPRIDGDDDGLVAVEETRLPGVEPQHYKAMHSFMQWRTDILDEAIQFFKTA